MISFDFLFINCLSFLSNSITYIYIIESGPQLENLRTRSARQQALRHVFLYKRSVRKRRLIYAFVFKHLLKHLLKHLIRYWKSYPKYNCNLSARHLSGGKRQAPNISCSAIITASPTRRAVGVRFCAPAIS